MHNVSPYIAPALSRLDALHGDTGAPLYVVRWRTENGLCEFGTTDRKVFVRKLDKLMQAEIQYTLTVE